MITSGGKRNPAKPDRGHRHTSRATTHRPTLPEPVIRERNSPLHVGTFTGPAGLFRQTTQPGAEARRLHTTLDLPSRILDLDPDQPTTR